jgi:hypothetical protein
MTQSGHQAFFEIVFDSANAAKADGTDMRGTERVLKNEAQKFYQWRSDTTSG